MIGFIASCGPFGFALSVLTVLTLVTSFMAFRHRSYRFIPVITGLVSAAVGFLGQTTGIYNSLTVIIPAEELNPAIVSAGLRESFNSTWWGIGLLVIGILVWIATTILNGRRT